MSSTNKYLFLGTIYAYFYQNILIIENTYLLTFSSRNPDYEPQLCSNGIEIIEGIYLQLGSRTLKGRYFIVRRKINEDSTKQVTEEER